MSDKKIFFHQVAVIGNGTEYQHALQEEAEPIGIYVQFHNHWMQLVVLKPECKLYQLNKQPVASMAHQPWTRKG